MAENSKIEWCRHTFNHVRGCTKVAEGCKFCYADTLSKRNPGTLGIWGPNGTRVVASESMWREPVKWNREAACCCCKELADHEHEAGCPQSDRPRVFCASLADVFEDWSGECLDSSGCAHYTRDNDPREMVRNFQMVGCDTDGYHYTTLSDVRRRLFALIDATPNLDWLLLTKRPENIRAMWPSAEPQSQLYQTNRILYDKGTVGDLAYRSNVWLGTSVATQEDADRNIPHLLACRDLSPVLFVSAEPLLGPVDLTALGVGTSYQWQDALHGITERADGSSRQKSATINWVIAGGESGPHGRPCHPDWARSLRDQCQAAEVPFLFKQWGEYLHVDQCLSLTESLDAAIDDSGYMKVGKKSAGRELDGREWNEYPKTTVDENNVSR